MTGMNGCGIGYLGPASKQALHYSLAHTKTRNYSRMKPTLTALTIAAALFASSAYAFDPADLQKLKDTNACSSCDLKNAYLRGADLASANLMSADLSGANLSGADLSGADLSDANLIFTEMNGANLSGALLKEADLFGANLEGAIMRGAILCETLMPDYLLSDSDC